MDYFNEEERASQRAFSKWRDGALSPAINFMIRRGITPNHVTIFGIILLIVGCALPPNFFLAIPALLLLYCLVDGIDGPLARRMGIAHEGGAIIDICADQAGVVAVAAATVYHMGANGPAAVLFSGAYLSFITLALYANGRDIPLWGFIRIKYFFYFVYSCSVFFLYDLTSYLMAAFALYYTFYILHALCRIYAHHNQLALTGASPAQQDSDAMKDPVE